MTIGISKKYTPTPRSGGDATAYNIDIAALFDAFSGLEAQTSPIGGLTITPATDGTTKFLITNTATTELLSADTTNSRFKLKATARLYFDGGVDTYITESAADILDVYVGAANMMKFTEAASNKIEILGSDLEIDATKKLYLDGGGNTYIHEVGADTLAFVAGGTQAMKISTTTVTSSVDLALAITKKMYLYGSDTYIWTGANPEIIFHVDGAERMKLQDTTGDTGGSGSAGAGKQYVELSLGGSRYKLLHDGTL